MSNAAQKTILFTGATLPEEHKKKLENLGYHLKIERSDLSEDELIQALQGISAYILGGDEIATRKVIESAKELKIIAFFGVGYEAFVDAKAATDCGIAIANTPGANAQSVAEFTVALILSAINRIPMLVESTKHGGWKTSKTCNLQGKTIGIVGLGNIGSCVAKIMHNGFGMKILYASRGRKPALDSLLNAEYVKLNDLLSRSDIVTMHPSLNEQTRGMIGEKELQLMKPTSVLVNCSRAPVIDPYALYNALSNRKIACAAMDGYYTEPAPEPKDDQFKLLSLPDDLLLVTPHTAYYTEEATHSMADMSLASVLAMLENKPVPNVVNPEYEKNLQQKDYAAK